MAPFALASLVRAFLMGQPVRGGMAALHGIDGGRAAWPSHAFSHLALFPLSLPLPDNFCIAKVVGAAVVQNQPADALFGNAFKSSYVCMYFIQGVSLKNAFACFHDEDLFATPAAAAPAAIAAAQLQKDQTEPAVSLPSTMSRIVNVPCRNKAIGNFFSFFHCIFGHFEGHICMSSANQLRLAISKQGVQLCCYAHCIMGSRKNI